MDTSVWSSSVKLPEFAALKGNLKTDVLVIGGGICGLMCAYFLKQAGIDCTVVEAGRIAGGVTCNTTAKITALHGLIYGDLVEKSGFEVAQKYLFANQQAVKEFTSLAGRANCDFEAQTAFTYSLQNEKKITEEFSALKALGAQAELRYQSPLPIPFVAAVGLQNQAQFHPLKFINHIIKDLKIYEHTRVTEFTPQHILYDGGKIHAEKIIVATHFPILNKHGLYFLKLYQHRSYVLALDNTPPLDGL